MRHGKFNLPTAPGFLDSLAKVRHDGEKRNESGGMRYRVKTWKRQYSVNNLIGNKEIRSMEVGHVRCDVLHAKDSFCLCCIDKHNLFVASFTFLVGDEKINVRYTVGDM